LKDEKIQLHKEGIRQPYPAFGEVLEGIGPEDRKNIKSFNLPLYSIRVMEYNANYHI